jgi:hypothetical protein
MALPDDSRASMRWMCGGAVVGGQELRAVAAAPPPVLLTGKHAGTFGHIQDRGSTIRRHDRMLIGDWHLDEDQTLVNEIESAPFQAVHLLVVNLDAVDDAPR